MCVCITLILPNISQVPKFFILIFSPYAFFFFYGKSTLSSWVLFVCAPYHSFFYNYDQIFIFDVHFTSICPLLARPIILFTVSKFSSIHLLSYLILTVMCFSFRVYFFSLGMISLECLLISLEIKIILFINATSFGTNF